MITIYKDKKDIPPDMEYVEWNDLFFNRYTAGKLDIGAAKWIKQIDGVELAGRYQIRSKFNGTVIDIDCLSTGCKTVLNVLYFPEKVFCIKECGENALEVLYQLEQGAVYSDYAMIPFESVRVRVVFGKKESILDDYEKLKEWWGNEK